MKILVVDSRRPELEWTVSALGERYPDAEIVATEDGMEAVQYSLNHPVDAVYTEVLMPRINGFSVARLVRKFQPGAKACIVSGTDAFLERAKTRGLSGYYLKPLNPAGGQSGNLLAAPEPPQAM